MKLTPVPLPWCGMPPDLSPEWLVVLYDATNRMLPEDPGVNPISLFALIRRHVLKIER